ncbi:formyltetrahydrofolate deformylase [Castellaniella sp.]|uniref:formyltetrahydrofolate deformylase n=1 Tax=Castellaniella sp. TaxID=1955812 RepID=UPI002AFFAA8F|nr:formyltetrahydrofolate deformylase [Castellaniella sp.]
MHDYILTLSCHDRMGIVHAFSAWLLQHHGNIVHAQQFGDLDSQQFFLRVHFSLPAHCTDTELEADFLAVAERFGMQFHIHDASRKTRLLILVSRQGHCLNDLLFRVRNEQMAAEVVGVASNHLDLQPMAAAHGLPFHHLPVSADTRVAQEARLLALVKESHADLVVLARYMQILSTDLCKALEGRAINIHHSFLPSFKGARPYHQAHARGVKLIGATAHYVTQDLDEGPIIEQDIERVDHAMNPQDLSRIGSDIESVVLSRAVRWHVEHRILLNGKRTVVFR